MHILNRLLPLACFLVACSLSGMNTADRQNALARPKAQATVHKKTEKENKAKLAQALSAKKLLKAFKWYWGDPAPGIIEVFYQPGPLAILPLREIIMGYYDGNDCEVPLRCEKEIAYEKRMIDSRQHGWFLPIQGLKFNDARTHITAIFAPCTQEEYRAQDSPFKRAGSKAYCFKSATAEQQVGRIAEDNFNWTTTSAGTHCDRWMDGCVYRTFRIEEQTVGISDDEFLKAQVEFELKLLGYCDPCPDQPGKFLRPPMACEDIHISIYINVAKIVKAILTPGFLELQPPSNCVIS